MSGVDEDDLIVVELESQSLSPTLSLLDAVNFQSIFNFRWGFLSEYFIAIKVHFINFLAV